MCRGAERVNAERLWGVLGLSKHCGLLSVSIGLVALGRWWWNCYPACCIPYSHEELPWSASPVPAAGSTAPLLTGGMLSLCHCVLLVDIMKSAKVSLDPTAQWTHGKGQQSPFCSLLITSSWKGLVPRTPGKDIKLPSMSSPLAESHQPLLLQTLPHAFVLCH